MMYNSGLYDALAESLGWKLADGEKQSHIYVVENKYTPTRILKSGPCTIVFWNDGTKTMVRRAADEVEDDYSAFTAALAIKIFGSNSAVKRTVKNKLVEQIKKTKNNT